MYRNITHVGLLNNTTENRKMKRRIRRSWVAGEYRRIKSFFPCGCITSRRLNVGLRSCAVPSRVTRTLISIAIRAGRLMWYRRIISVNSFRAPLRLNSSSDWLP